MEKKTKVARLMSKLAYKVGEDSVGKCGIWFNQPKVPEALKLKNAKSN